MTTMLTSVLSSKVRTALYGLAVVLGATVEGAHAYLGATAVNVPWYRALDSVDGYLLALVGGVAVSHVAASVSPAQGQSAAGGVASDVPAVPVIADGGQVAAPVSRRSSADADVDVPSVVVDSSADAAPVPAVPVQASAPASVADGSPVAAVAAPAPDASVPDAPAQAPGFVVGPTPM